MTFTQKWARLALLNFLVLASVGVILRYKILFPLPFVDHKHLLHGHSHFAFAGWVSLALYVAILHVLQPNEVQQKQFSRLLWAQQLSSYGMLFTFPFTGYAAASVTFSTLSIFVSFWFAFTAGSMIKKNTTLTFEKKWFYAGLVCNIISAAGTFTLAYLMVNRIMHQSWYFGSVYFYLHFQYNGWFLFTIMGLLFTFTAKWMNDKQADISNRFFILLITALLPAWFLSMLWMRIPHWVHYAGIAAAVLQLVAIGYYARLFLLFKPIAQQVINPQVKWLWLFSILAFVAKNILQAFSAIPELNKYAFGIRPVVIGFLHLVLLGFVSFFILGFFTQYRLITTETKAAKKGLWIFITGVLLNEIVLMLQGIAAIRFTDIPYSNYFLLGIALLIFSGLLLLVTNQQKKEHTLPG